MSGLRDANSGSGGAVRKKAAPKTDDKTKSTKDKATTGSDRKTKKFVNLYTEEGKDRETVQLRGRHPCNCLASKHQLVNNCTSCGRIVCAQEGSGSCFTCGQLVATPSEMELLTRDSRKAAQLRQKLEDDDAAAAAALAAAVAHKDRLLEFDRSCAKRTQVIDDDRDYFTSGNKWLTQKERSAIKEFEEKRDQARSKRGNRTKMDIDFAGRKVIVKDEENVPDLYLPDTVEAIDEAVDNLPSYLGDRKLTELEFVSNGDIASLKASTAKMSDNMHVMKLQDSHLMEISDDAMCLSMHQPYASLLLAGIKRHEGRQWFHSHRGRLWIHAAAKRPTSAEIEEVLNVYRLIHPDMASKAPKEFPTGVLLGCVDVVDCLTQGTYRKQFPEGEISDAYVFICESPLRLRTPFPMRGGLKIFKLDSKLHNAARKQIIFTADATG